MPGFKASRGRLTLLLGAKAANDEANAFTIPKILGPLQARLYLLHLCTMSGRTKPSEDNVSVHKVY